MFCLLPPTRLALGHLSPDRVPDASGLFNLMRNLGGAIGLALIDTVIYSRAPAHGLDLMARLQAGDTAAATFVGIPPQVFAALPPGPLDAATQGLLAPLLEKAALTAAINDAWLLIAVLTGIALLCVPFARGLQAPEKHL
jgi:DHA2 family multidrug resistance protein